MRSLAGVLHAHVQTGPRGIEGVHVIAADHETATALAGHVRSALLAGLATPVRPARITVRVADPDDLDPDPGYDLAPRPALRAVSVQDDPPPAPRAGRAPRAGWPGRTEPTPAAAADDAAPAADGPERARLVAVDLDPDAASCRVTLVHDGALHRGEATARGKKATPLDAAALAALRALAQAGFDGLEIHGMAQVEVGGRDYVLVALRHDHDDHDGPVSPGCAACFGSAERAAAEATIAAANGWI